MRGSDVPQRGAGRGQDPRRAQAGARRGVDPQRLRLGSQTTWEVRRVTPNPLATRNEAMGRKPQRLLVFTGEESFCEVVRNGFL